MRGAQSDADKVPTTWSQRLTALQATRHFDLNGRVAVSNGSDGLSAGIRWQQNDDQSVIDLTAPLGFGAAHIQQTDDLLRVTTSKGVTLDSDAAGEELRTTLGFDPPLKSLRYWILGASDPGSVAQESVDASQRLAHLEQEGWSIDYGDYTRYHNNEWLPQSMTATHEKLRLKLVIHDWQLYRILGE